MVLAGFFIRIFTNTALIENGVANHQLTSGHGALPRDSPAGGLSSKNLNSRDFSFLYCGSLDMVHSDVCQRRIGSLNQSMPVATYRAGTCDDYGGIFHAWIGLLLRYGN